MKVGLFIDARFRREAGRLWCGSELLGFTTFAAAVGARLGGITIIGRGGASEAEAPYPLPPQVGFKALPAYESLRDLPGLARVVPAMIAALWRAPAGLDLVWISTAAHPFGLLLCLFALLRGKRVAFLVRQDTMAYFRHRLPGPRWLPVLAPLWLLDRLYRLLSRVFSTTVVGEEIAASLGAPRENLLDFEVNLFTSEEIAAPRPGEWDGPIELLTVGRIEPEKNPLLAVELMRRLELKEPGRYTLTWVGTGREAPRLREAAERAGLGERIRLPGFIAPGEGLRAFYDRADAFVHISLTEGVPGVLSEAMAAGLPVVATDVGGVRAATADAALHVKPRDPAALAAAIGRLAGDAALRERLTAAGAARARRTALDVESRRVAHFLRRSLGAAGESDQTA